MRQLPIMVIAGAVDTPDRIVGATLAAGTDRTRSDIKGATLTTIERIWPWGNTREDLDFFDRFSYFGALNLTCFLGMNEFYQISWSCVYWVDDSLIFDWCLSFGALEFFIASPNMETSSFEDVLQELMAEVTGLYANGQQSKVVCWSGIWWLMVLFSVTDDLMIA